MKKQIWLAGAIGLAFTAGAQQKELSPYRYPLNNKVNTRLWPLSGTAPKISPASPHILRFQTVLPNGTLLMTAPAWHMPVISGVDLSGPMPNPAYPQAQLKTFFLPIYRTPGRMPNCSPFPPIQ